MSNERYDVVEPRAEVVLKSEICDELRAYGISCLKNAREPSKNIADRLIDYALDKAIYRLNDFFSV